MKTRGLTVFSLIVFCAASTMCAPNQGALAEAKSQYAAFQGMKVHYKSMGAGSEALVFVHCWSCNLNFWHYQAPAFAGKSRMLFIDLPGHGQSDKPEIAYTMDMFARAIDAVMRDAKVSRAVFVGHSMGTPVIRQFYRLYPEKVLALIVLDGALRNLLTDPAQIESFIAPLRGTDFKTAAARFVDGVLPATMPSDLRQEIRTAMLSAPQHVMVGAMEGMFKDSTIWKADPIRVPLQLLLAPNPMWNADYEAFVRSLAPDVDYRMFGNVSHFLMMEKPDPVNQAMREFLVKNRLLGYK